MAAYYNEIDPFAAAWLRELIKAGLIADGEVDERSIEHVQPSDLAGFQQCHFFAGIGGWSLALRLAGWLDESPVWTGSCPCQPFSSAGAQAGGHDPRDLWPVWFQLVKKCRPVVVFGEQVEAAIGHGWLDRLCDDLEAEDYAVGACGLPGPCVGAFDKRQRLWFVADSRRERCAGERLRVLAGEPRQADVEAGWDGEVGQLGDATGRRQREGRVERTPPLADGEGARQLRADHASELGDAASDGREAGQQQDRARLSEAGSQGWLEQSGIGAFNFWRYADWLPCADGKARPVEPGTFPLAYGVPARVGRLRGYGNAIKPQVAQVFIEAYMSTQSQQAVQSPQEVA